MKKIKKILIFIFIAVLGFLSFALPLSVSAQTNPDYDPASIKLSFYQFTNQQYTGPGDYTFDFSNLPSYYDYFIFDFDQWTIVDLYVVNQNYTYYEIKTYDGLYFKPRQHLVWEIYFDEDFIYFNFILIATNFEYITNLIGNEYVNGYDDGYDDGYDKGLDDVYEYGFRPLDTQYENQGSLPYQLGYYNGVESVEIIDYEDVYNDGYDKGYDNGYDNGIKKVYNYGFIGTDFNDNKSYPYYQGYNKGIDIASDNTFYGIISQVFTGIGTFLAIELLPNITFGAIFAVPLVFGIIFFIIGKRGGKDD